jgi:SAM-dependent methyltransferase
VADADWPLVRAAAAIAGLREALEREGFTPEGIQAAFGEAGTFVRDPSDIPLYLRRLQPEAPLTTLIKLFVLDLAVPRADAEAAVAPTTVGRLVAARVLRPEGDDVAATLNLAPMHELVLASDQYEGKGPPRPDHVLGISISARVLAAVTVRHFVPSALDIGTGCGIHALLAARHARRVVGADISPRALRFAEFNAALNGIDHAEFREGNVFDPVEGERFDLIVSNPPYVVSPDTEYAYRDSGLPGDSFSEGLVRRLPEFLEEDGLAHVLVAWAHGGEDDWSLPPRSWVEGSGCDALVLHFGSQDPLSYAGVWNAELRGDPGVYGSAIDRWVDYDRRLGIDRIGWGALVLRRRSGRNWVKAMSPGFERIGPAAHHIERLFAAQDFLSGLGPGNGLLEGVFELPEDHRFDQTFTLAAGEGVLERSALRLEGGLRTEWELDPLSVRIVTLLDGRRPLYEIVAQAATDAPGGLSPEAYSAQTLPSVARMLELGLVVPRG